MSDVCGTDERERKPPRRIRSIYQVHYGLRGREAAMTSRPLAAAGGGARVQAYARQVAGHHTAEDAGYVGLLQCSDGRILKPILKETQRREVVFYERLAAAGAAPELQELRKMAPRYYGVRKHSHGGRERDYIAMEDLTDRMLEPCIMDVKIGKRTWDPFASAEKIENEESKYRSCKQEYGFCIPGYQVYRLDSGELRRYGKQQGKRLHGQAVLAAIREYLNASEGVACRALVLQLLAALWALQRWAARATRLRLVATSLLLVYDAARLRACCAPPRHRGCAQPPLAPARSAHSAPTPSAGSNFSGQLDSGGPVYRKVSPVPLSPMAQARGYFAPPPPLASPWSEALEKLDHSHSFEHNYEEKLSKIKMNYRAQLDRLASESPGPSPWGTARLIDFAHAYFCEDAEATVDYNFKEGVDSLVRIFESLLRETDDRIA